MENRELPGQVPGLRALNNENNAEISSVRENGSSVMGIERTVELGTI